MCRRYYVEMEIGPRKSGSVVVWVLAGWFAGGVIACDLANLQEPMSEGGNQFGTSVTVSGDLIVVGALAGDVGGEDAGAVHVYRVEQGGVSFVESLGLVDGEDEDFFGASVATDGELIVAGAPESSDGGRAAVFRRNVVTGDFEFEDTFLPPGNMPIVSRFGAAVAVEGDWAVIGAPGEDGDIGSVDLFHFFNDAGQWGFVQRLETGVAGDEFGASVAMNGRHLVVGVPNDATIGPGGGCAIVYVLNETGEMWIQDDVLKAPSAGAFASLGSSVAIDETRVVAGAPFATEQGSPTGAAFVFADGKSGWDVEQKLVVDEAGAFDFVGGSVAISGERVIVGSALLGADNRGAAYVFEFDRGRGEWVMGESREGISGSRLGQAVALHDDVAIVGGPQADGIGQASGMAVAMAVAGDVDVDEVFNLCDNCRFVFNEDQSDSNDNGVGDYCESIARACERQMVTASDASALSRYGHAVDASKEWAVVGARFGNGVNAASGSAYVLRFSGEQWAETEVLVASDGRVFDEFGFAVAVDDVIVVGAPLVDDVAPDAGAVYVFRYDMAADAWVEEQKLLASDGEVFDGFGHAVATAGDVIAVGVPNRNAAGEFSGAVYVFRFDPKIGQWTEEAKLVAEDTVPFDEFGQSVAMDDDVILIGAWRDDDAGVSSGSAYVFRYEFGQWVEEQKLTATDAAPSQRFGGAVSIDGDVAVVGAHQSSVTLVDAGAAHVFQRDDMSGDWIETQKLEASDAAVLDQFGEAVSVEGTSIVVGSRSADTAADNGGAAYVFAFDGDEWVERSVVTPSDIEPNEEFGRAVAVAGNWVLVGSRFDEPAGTESGSAYFYRIAGLDDDRDGVLNECDNCLAVANENQVDCDENDVGDACVMAGDVDGDGLVTLVDFSTLAECQVGDLADDCNDLCTAGFDFDADGDTDLLDFGTFQAVFDDIK